MIRSALDYLQTNPDVAIVYTDALYFGAVNRLERTADFDFTLLRYQNHLNYCALFRREVWERAGGYNPNMVWGYEDWDFWISCAEKGFKAHLIPEPLFLYRVKAQSMYATALAHDLELRARIVLNHPTLYPDPTPKWARAILDHAAPPSELPDPHEILTRAKTFTPWRQGRRSTDIQNVVLTLSSTSQDVEKASFTLLALGHRVFVIGDGAAGKIPAGAEFVQLQESLPHQAGHFFSDNQEYSYRILHTLRNLAQKARIDAIEFPVCGAPAFAAIRAKRLLNEFGGTKLIVRLDRPLSLQFKTAEIKSVYAAQYCDFAMEDYCARHADHVHAPSLDLAEYFSTRIGRKDIQISPEPPLDIFASPLSPRTWLHPAGKKVSAVIPFFNQGQYLAEAIQSVRDSQWPDLEIVVVNDGSTEAASNEAFEATEGVVKIRQPNRGLGAARNAGIKAATGEYVLTLDADDKIHPDYIASAVAALENNPSLSYVTCHAQNFGVLDELYIPVGFVPALMPFLNTDGKCANVYRREVFAKCGGYDESLVSYEDWDFLMTLHDHGLEGDVLPVELFLYRRHYDSMVYTVADPKRMELIQQLMLKHRGLLNEDPKLIAVLLAGLWMWQAIRSDAALKREARLLQEETWKVQQEEIKELQGKLDRETDALQRKHADGVSRLRAENDQRRNELLAQHERQLGELRAQQAQALKDMRVQQIYSNGVPVSTRDMKFMLRKYLKRKLGPLGRLFF
jgi:glycosyltransferase involved in cell wall biosynthesis